MNKKRLAIIVVLGVAFILVLAMLIILESQSYVYVGKNGEEYLFNVVRRGEITSHVVRVYGGRDGSEYNYPFRYGPKDLENLDLDMNIRDKLLSSNSGKLKEAIYITQDPELGDVTGSNSVLSVLEINRITGTATYGFYKIPTYTAITRETERSKKLELPVVTCEDARDSVGVILLKQGDNSKAYLDGDCVVIESENDEDFVKLADKVALHLLNVF